MASKTGFKSSLIKLDVYFVNDGPIRSKMNRAGYSSGRESLLIEKFLVVSSG